MTTTKELRQQRAKLIADAIAITSNPKANAADQARASAMLNQVDRLKAQIDTIERVESLSAELSEPIRNLQSRSQPFAIDPQRERNIFARIYAGDGPSLPDRDKQYVAQVIARDWRILKAVSSGDLASLSPEDQAHHAATRSNPRAAAGTGAGSTGGYTVAPIFEADMAVALKAFGGMRAVATVINTPNGAALPWPTMDDTANQATIIGTENTQLSADTDLTFGQVSIGAYTYRAGPMLVTLELMQDSAFNFDALIREAMTTRFGRAQNQHFTYGDGSGKPFGVITGAALGKTGAAGNVNTVMLDDLVDLEHSVDPAYRKGARWMFSDATLRIIRQYADLTGRPLWQPGLTDGTPDTFLGYPFTINQDLPAMVPNAKSILFGDFKHYVIRDTLGMQVAVLRERFADSLQVAWLAYLRTDGRLITAGQPIKFYQQPAA